MFIKINSGGATKTSRKLDGGIKKMDEKKYYEVYQRDATGKLIEEARVLVVNPSFEGAGIHATMVGYWHDRVYGYRSIEPKDYIIIGEAVCIEYTGKLYKFVY